MGTPAVELDVKQEFENTAPGWLGVTVITGRNQDPKAIPVAPGSRVFLSREEQILTSRAYRSDSESPFNNGLNAVAAPGQIKSDIRVPFDEQVSGDKAAESSDSNGTGAAEEPPVPEITGVEPQAAGDAAIGQQAADEIAGTPEAQTQTASVPATAAAPTTPAAPAAPRAPVAKATPSVPKPLGTP